MDMRRWLGAGGLGLLVVLGILVGGPLGAFVDVPSALIVFVGGTAAWFAVCGKDVLKVGDTLEQTQPSRSDLALARMTVKTGRRAVWLTSAIGTIIGIIQMLAHIDDWNALGPASAVALLTLFYAFLADVFALSPLAQRVAVKQAELEAETPLQRQVHDDLRASRSALDALKKRAEQHAARTGAL